MNNLQLVDNLIFASNLIPDTCNLRPIAKWIIISTYQESSIQCPVSRTIYGIAKHLILYQFFMRKEKTASASFMPRQPRFVLVSPETVRL